MQQHVEQPEGAGREPVTQVLARAAAGDSGAGRELLPLVYDQLRALATQYLAGEQAGHTLQPTALVHEAYLRLVGSEGAPGTEPAGRGYTGRTHFMAAAASVMRNVLVDHARRRSAAKRGGRNNCRVALHDADAATAAEARDLEVLELNDLLDRLARLDTRRSRVVELKFFAGMTNDEVAEVLGVSRWTVAQDWAVARAWLAGELVGD